MTFYWTLLRIDRTKTADALKWMKNLPKENKKPHIKVYYVANIFGEWDNCVWFEAENHDHAMNYVQNKLAKIPGVVHTYTLPTTPIQEYYRHWK